LGCKFVTVYFLFEKKTFNGLLKVISIQMDIEEPLTFYFYRILR